jgi:hypothetical protein
MGAEHTCLNGHCESPFLASPSTQDAETYFALDVEIGMKSRAGMLNEFHLWRYLPVN